MLCLDFTYWYYDEHMLNSSRLTSTYIRMRMRHFSMHCLQKLLLSLVDPETKMQSSTYVSMRNTRRTAASVAPAIK